MKNVARIVCIGLLALVVSALAVALFACDKKPEVPDVQIILEGDLYGGASVPLGANLAGNAAKHAQDAVFEIVEGTEYCYIYRGNLNVRNDAPYGATITVRVSVGEQWDQVSKTIDHTPVQSVSLNAISPMAAGANVVLSCEIEPWYADDNAVTYVLAQGDTIATLEGNQLALSDGADHTDKVGVYALCGGVRSETVYIAITTIQATSIAVSADTYTLNSGGSVTLSGQVVPANASFALRYALVPDDYADLYVTLNDNMVYVSDAAIEGSFVVRATAGKIQQDITFTVGKTPVDSVTVTRADSASELVSYGDFVSLSARVYPVNATYRTVTFCEIKDDEDREDYVIISQNGFYVITQKVGVPIVIRAAADDKYAEIRFVTQGIAATDVELSLANGQTTAVTVGESRQILAHVVPQNCTDSVRLVMESGDEYATLSGDTITFTAIDTEDTVVRVLAIVGSVQRYITFHIVPVPVTDVVLGTTDATTGLHDGDTVTFSAVVSPTNATFSQVTYTVVEGQAYGTMQDNVFTVSGAPVWGQVKVVATTPDGVQSNPIVLELEGDVVTLSYTQWSQLDNRATLLDGYTEVCLDLRSMPMDAGDTVVVVSDDVSVLTLMGVYSGTLDTSYTNLYFYFLTTDNVTLNLRDVGITITNGFTDAVLDCGTATLTINAIGDNYIAAGDAYSVSTTGYMLEGAYDASYSMRRNGMDGFCGLDGGVALVANRLIFAGDGNLTLRGGSASSGTNGTAGADTSISNNVAGNGGNGGNGGVGGSAVVCTYVAYRQKGNLALYAGTSATGGLGGAAGSGSATGTIGRDGDDGKIVSAVSAQVIVTDTMAPSLHEGSVVARTATRNMGTVDQGVATLSRHYKVDIYYDAGWANLHSSYAGGTRYDMTKQTSSTELFRLLHGLDYTLGVFGRNMMLDLASRYGHNVVYYLCATITSQKLLGSSSNIYGLTDDSGNVWFATFTTRPRDTFYSTYYNIMVHEVFHLLYYGMAANAMLSEAKLRPYNNNLAYTQNSTGVYTGADADAPFLTTYSKKNNMEDISETLSILCVQARKPSFASANTKVGKKATYITNLFVAEYHSLASWRTPYWMRYVY